MRGLDLGLTRASILFEKEALAKKMDCRVEPVEPGNDRHGLCSRLVNVKHW
jgi:hypothetical protein